MAASCPEPEILGAYHAGALPEPEREALERHGAACRLCRETLLALATRPHTAEPPGQATLARLKALRRSSRRPWAAAAAILIALGAGWILLPGRPQPVPAPLPLSADSLPEAFPEGRLAAGDAPRACLVQGTELLLDQGARVAFSSRGRRLRPESGTLWLEISRGGPVTLDLPGAELSLSRGTLCLSLPARASACFLREAEAEETSGRIWLLDGEAEARLGQQVLTLRGASSLTLGPEGWTQASMPAEELQARWEARAALALSLPGRRLFPAGTRLDEGRTIRGGTETPGAYRWVTALSGRGSSAELTFSLPAAGGWHGWTPGLAARPPRAREVVELLWDGAWLSGRLDGRLLFAIPAERLPKDLNPLSSPGWALSVWGGSVTVERSVLQEIQ